MSNSNLLQTSYLWMKNVAVLAADVSVKYRLSMADAIIKATADLFDAKIVTSDEHLGKLKGVQLIR